MVHYAGCCRCYWRHVVPGLVVDLRKPTIARNAFGVVLFIAFSLGSTRSRLNLSCIGVMAPAPSVKFLKDYTVLTKNGKNIILCWIPSHVGILGNEKADATAKSALTLPVTRMKLPATGMYPRITKLIFDEWQEVWNCCAGNELHSIRPTCRLLQTENVSIAP